MKPRNLVIFWPLIASPLFAVALVAYTGPSYDANDGGVNQAGIVFRMLSLIAWLVVLIVGVIVTLMRMKNRNKEDILVHICSGIGGAFLSYIIATTLN